MPTGPKGEKRPTGWVSSIMKAMKVATGIEPEEYVGDKKSDGSSDDEDEADGYEYLEEDEGEYEIAALKTSVVEEFARRA